jgi:hypothetical protein
VAVNWASESGVCSAGQIGPVPRPSPQNDLNKGEQTVEQVVYLLGPSDPFLCGFGMPNLKAVSDRRKFSRLGFQRLSELRRRRSGRSVEHGGGLNLLIPAADCLEPFPSIPKSLKRFTACGLVGVKKLAPGCL